MSRRRQVKRQVRGRKGRRGEGGEKRLFVAEKGEREQWEGLERGEEGERRKGERVKM